MFSEKIKYYWSDENDNLVNRYKSSEKFNFLSRTFLRCFENKQKSLEYLYFTFFESSEKFGRASAQLFDFSGSTLQLFLRKNKGAGLVSFLFKFLSFRLLSFGNVYFTNVKSVEWIKDISKLNLKNWFKIMAKDLSIDVFVLPSNFISSSQKAYQSESFLHKVQVEPNMRLTINQTWENFNDYFDALSSKYKKKYNRNKRDSSSLVCKQLNVDSIKNELNNLQALFNQVFEESSFSPPRFNLQSYVDLKEKYPNTFKLNAYYLENRLVSFSTEFVNGDILYSHFIGIDYQINKKYGVYAKMLYDIISNGISYKCKEVIFGRTASEFKSNFGAEPVEDYVYIFFSNPFIHWVFGLFANKIAPKEWNQRKPFK